MKRSELKLSRRTSLASSSSEIGSTIFNRLNSESQKTARIVRNASNITLPWTYKYKTWWSFTVLAAGVTYFFETYQIAFLPVVDDSLSYNTIISFILTLVFVVDIMIQFNLAYFDENHDIIVDRRNIAKNYLKFQFWIDFIGVFPFYGITIQVLKIFKQTWEISEYLSLLKLVRLVRLYRIKQLFQMTRYSSKISLLRTTLIRNFFFSMGWTHFVACVMYFMARIQNFKNKTWIGEVNNLNDFDEYLTSLYLSIVTFTTVGYGDFYPVSTAEQLVGIVYMLLNIAFMSYFIGSITLLVVKDDALTGMYRDSLEALETYSIINGFEPSFYKRLRKHLKLYFGNRELSDEQVLQHFPNTVRRRVMRELYFPFLAYSHLMRGVKQKVVDAFLLNCTVEILSVGEQFLQQGQYPFYLHFLLSGVIELKCGNKPGQLMNYADFVNELSFFTESMQSFSATTKTVCKILTISRDSYDTVVDPQPLSHKKILENLLYRETNSSLSKKYLIQADDVPLHINDTSYYHNAISSTSDSMPSATNLIERAIEKQIDRQINQFLFAASRDTSMTIAHMLDTGFDPDCKDFDDRTALMVASMKGRTDTVKKLLCCGANPNIRDVHGSTALMEAVQNGHEEVIDLLLQFNAELGLQGIEASAKLCSVVFDGDVYLLERLLRAHIDVNAGDYDQRTALHISVSEGVLPAVKILLKYNADIHARDRWGRTPLDDARRTYPSHIFDYLVSIGLIKKPSPNTQK